METAMPTAGRATWWWWWWDGETSTQIRKHPKKDVNWNNNFSVRPRDSGVGVTVANSAVTAGNSAITGTNRYHWTFFAGEGAQPPTQTPPPQPTTSLL